MENESEKECLNWLSCPFGALPPFVTNCRMEQNRTE
jgi:hypothetical protein